MSGWLDLSLVDTVVLVGFAVVLPLVIGALPWWWVAATAALPVAFALPRGPAWIAVLPIVVAAAAALAAALRAAGRPGSCDLSITAHLLALLYGNVAALALLVSRAGLELLDQHEPIVELTAVHYTVAGTGALALAARALDGRPGSRFARTGVVLTGAAPPVVALGFLTASALPQVGGAVLMTLGVWCTAALELVDARHARGVPRVLLVLSGLAIWVPMVLAVAWAAGQHWAIPILSIPDMARTHGLVNAFAFVIGGLVARRLVVAQPARQLVDSVR